MWPSEMQTLIRLGQENLAQIAAFCSREGIDADLRICGKTTVAVTPHQAAALQASVAIHREFDEPCTWLDAEQVRADIASPTYLAGLRTPGSSGLIDPARLAWGLACAASVRGVRLHEESMVSGIVREGEQLRVHTELGQVRARRVILATNAYPPLLRRLRAWVLPIFDHVLVSEPLTPSQWASIGWSERQGLTDAGNQFHYYRPTADGRILWGGFDAIYYFGNDTKAAREQRLASHQLLADHFFTTFPQLEGLRFTHRWAGLIDSTSRFTPAFGLAKGGNLAYAVGYTGLGVGASRFGVQVALDLLSGEQTERSRLQMVRRRPVPFPPEPLRYPLVQATRAALAREDSTGRRGAWLSLLDRLKIGFNS
jgi:glycine/D-amino acid oxidase-like deaminating enzyme